MRKMNFVEKNKIYIYKRLSREKRHVFGFAGICCNSNHFQIFSSQSLFLDAEQLVKIEENPDECTDYSSSDRSKDSDFLRFPTVSHSSF